MRSANKALLAALALLHAPALRAHSSPNSLVLLDFKKESVTAELTLPLPELELSYKQPLMAAPDAVIAQYGPALQN